MLLFFGLGVLPLTPLLALVATIVATKHLRRLRRAEGAKAITAPVNGRAVGIGLAAAIIVFLALELPTTITRYYLRLAASSSPEIRATGLRRLRTIGSENALLRYCHNNPVGTTDFIGSIISLGDPVTTEQARKIYYQVTGEAFKSKTQPQPAIRRTFDFERDLNLNRGGREVGGSLSGLSLATSRIDGSLDADTAIGYLEWMLVFKNSNTEPQEARALVALPPGGVVSRLTLWVNGEEREAAFGARAKVRAAYENIVRARRDPVLITTSGDDRVMVQCFPVPPGGEMKIRFGITAPLIFEKRENVILRLPNLLERNFELGEHAQHSVWFESKRPLESATRSISPEHPAAGLFAVRGVIEDGEMSRSYPTIRAQRSADVDQVWTRDPFSQAGEIIQQRLVEQEGPVPERIVMVVDGSRGMRDFIPAIAESLKKLREPLDLELIVASDEAKLSMRSREWEGWRKTWNEYLPVGVRAQNASRSCAIRFAAAALQQNSKRFKLPRTWHDCGPSTRRAKLSTAVNQASMKQSNWPQPISWSRPSRAQ